MPNDQSVLEYRVRESWRSRACTAGLCVGVQTFILGTGVAMPIALNSTWIAALAVLPASALVAAICRRTLHRMFLQDVSVQKKRGCRTLHVLLSLTLLANAVLSLGALISFAGQTLTGQARGAWSEALTLLAVFLCAFSGGTGVSRLCFVMRWALPVGMVALVISAASLEMPVGLFPLLGMGPLQLGAAGICMLGAASPALLLLLPPPEMEELHDQALRCPVPETAFFLRRVLVGAGIGIALLFAAGVCVTYESIAENAQWGDRLRVIAGDQPREGVRQMLLTLLQTLAMALAAAAELSCAEQALVRAFGRMRDMRAGLLALSALAAACLVGLVVFGFDVALMLAPGLVLPMLILPMQSKRLGAFVR